MCFHDFRFLCAPRKPLGFPGQGTLSQHRSEPLKDPVVTRAAESIVPDISSALLPPSAASFFFNSP